MEKKIEAKLYKKFKFLKKKILPKIECENGWANILQNLFQNIYDSNPSKDFIVTKVFEKCGDLKVYTKGGNNTTRFAIDAAIEFAADTCQYCGSNKELQQCDKCKEIDDGSSTYVLDISAAISAVDVADNIIGAAVNTATTVKLSTNPIDYYFKMIVGDVNCTPNDYFIITPKVYWDTNNCLYDDELEIDTLLENNGLYELEESIYEYSGQIQVGRTLLLSLGFIENNQMKLKDIVNYKNKCKESNDVI